MRTNATGRFGSNSWLPCKGGMNLLSPNFQMPSVAVCRVKAIRVISIHDRIDSKNQLFPETKPSDVLEMMGALPEEVLALRKTAEHMVNLQAKMIASLPKVSSTKLQKLDREKTVINLYAAGHPIDEIWRASGFKSRSSVFRILNKHGIKLNRGNHSGPIKKKNEEDTSKDMDKS